MKNRGFTLGEILIVVAIIGILSSIVWASLGGARMKGRDGARIADIKQIEQALEVYFSSCNAYPTQNSGNLPAELVSSSCGGNILSALPVDPTNTNPFVYKYYTANIGAGGLKYHICARLELIATGAGKSGQSASGSGIPQDGCNGANANTYDRYGP